LQVENARRVEAEREATQRLSLPEGARTEIDATVASRLDREREDAERTAAEQREDAERVEARRLEDERILAQRHPLPPTSPQRTDTRAEELRAASEAQREPPVFNDDADLQQRLNAENAPQPE
jgi:hypothetical protein